MEYCLSYPASLKLTKNLTRRLTSRYDDSGGLEASLTE